MLGVAIKPKLFSYLSRIRTRTWDDDKNEETRDIQTWGAWRARGRVPHGKQTSSRGERVWVPVHHEANVKRSREPEPPMPACSRKAAKGRTSKPGCKEGDDHERWPRLGRRDAETAAESQKVAESTRGRARGGQGGARLSSQFVFGALGLMSTRSFE